MNARWHARWLDNRSVHAATLHPLAPGSR
jgi:hypothetical protein